ncbi:MAG: DUF4835 family protein [Bacteroidales bacterium]|nr:DUF4835 family protein [Bacteroidales bacterium]
MNHPAKQVSILTLLLTLILSAGLSAQEFFCSVQVSAPNLQQTNREKFQELRQGLYELVNERRWTNYSMTRNERIECTMAITITEEISSDEFKGRINLVLKRPVFGTSYNTTMFNYLDNTFDFQWQEGQSLEYTENTFTSNLTSTIAYYIYIFLGLDFDSYQMMGGSPYFEKAQQIVSSAQGAREPGWKSFESTRNRYWLAENLNNSAYANVRRFWYQYHRLGLDIMQDNMERGRQGVITSLETLQRAHREKPNLFIMQLVLDAKRDEFINIFSQAAGMDRTKAVNILKEIDPSKSADYDRILREGQ